MPPRSFLMVVRCHLSQDAAGGKQVICTEPDPEVHLSPAPWWLYVSIGIYLIHVVDHYLGEPFTSIVYACATAGLITHATTSGVNWWRNRNHRA